MRVLFVTWGWRSHFFPLVPLAWALRTAGHDVRVATHPHLVTEAAATGLPAVAVGADLDFRAVFAADLGRVAENGEESEDRVAAEISADGGIVRHAEAMAEDLVAFGRQWRPDLVVYDPFNIAAPLLAQLLGVPAVRHLWGPDFSELLEVDEAKVTGQLAARFGGQPVRLAGDLTIDPCPPAMQLPARTPRTAVRFVPYNGTAVQPDWLNTDPGRPRVCLTWGTLFDLAAGAEALLVNDIADALSKLDIELVVSLTEAQRARCTIDAATVRLTTGPVALHLLLPTCAAIVHQGGAGTTLTAAALGVPQLIVPRITDQRFNAQQLAGAGAGQVLSGEPVTPAEVHDALRELLVDNEIRTAAAQLRAANEARPAPAALVPLLENLARQGR